MDAAVRAAGLNGSSIDLLVAHLAGLDLSIQISNYFDQAKACGVASKIVVDNDIFAVIRAGLAASTGVALVCGAGVGCAVIGPNGLHERYLALGELSGDFGGGVALGRRALFHAVRSEDGRGGPTILASRIAAHFALDCALDVAAATAVGRIDDSHLAAVTPEVFAAAELDQDPVALDLLQTLADECAAMVLALAGRVLAPTERLSLVLGGGIMRARSPLLVDRFESTVRCSYPTAEIDWLKARPVLRSALTALDHISAGDRSYPRLAEYFDLRAQGFPFRPRHERQHQCRR